MYPMPGRDTSRSALVTASCGSDQVVRNIPRNVVARHDFLHFAFVFRDVVAVVLAAVFHPAFVFIVDLLLVSRRPPPPTLTGIAAPGVTISGGNAIGRR